MPQLNARSICTAQRASGRFCESQSIPGAPFPICVHHAALVLEYLDSVMPRDLDDRVIVAWRGAEQDRERVAGKRARRRDVTDVVYYVRVGKHIKIGYTSNLPSRMRAYPPDSQLLGYELGGLSLEAQRHQEFADDLRMGREWFAPSARLLAHIAAVNVRRQAA